MTALAEWLARVVAVVLLATLVDLLLPNQTMQRYVRLVGGLLVLLTLASPVLSWFRSDYIDKLEAEMRAVKQSVDQQLQADDGELARISADGRKLGEAQNAQAMQLATAQLKQEIRAAVEQAGYGSVRTVDVGTEPDGAGSLRVSGVELTLEAAKAAPAGASASGDSGGGSGGGASGGGDDGDSDDAIADVEPVAPVDIRIDAEAQGQDGAAVPGFAGEDANARQPADGATASGVAALLAARFGVAPNQIRVWREPDGTAY